MLLRLYSYATWAFLALLGGRRRRLRIGDVELHYAVLGPADGEPWVLLHGLGATSITWSSVLRAFRRRARMVVPELSNLGGSRCPSGGLGVRDGAACVVRLIEHEFPGVPVTLGGMSLGAWIAVRLTLERPDLVSRLLLVDAAGYADQDWDRIERLVAVSDRTDVDRLYEAMYTRPPLVLRLSRGTFLEAFTSPAVRHVLESTTEEDAYDDVELARLEPPTGIVWGQLDGLFVPAVGRAIAAAVPRSKLIELEGVGHAVNWEAPRRLVASVEAIRNWWNDVDQPPINVS